MFLTLDLLFTFHMLHVGFNQSYPYPRDHIPLLHCFSIHLYQLWLSSYYSFYIGRALHCASFQIFPLYSLYGLIPTWLGPWPPSCFLYPSPFPYLNLMLVLPPLPPCTQGSLDV
jgi:hypothetical protein